MPFRASEELFSRPENDQSVLSEWKRFQQGLDADATVLRRLVDESWRRSKRASVDPGRGQAPGPISEDSLLALRDQCEELLIASRPVMALAKNFLAESGTVMVLTDASGTVLSLQGDVSTLGAAERVCLTPGASWSETACGTNAIGTAIATGMPVQIHSAEHYCEGIKRWTCSAVVIRDPLDKSVLGVLDVSGLTSSYSRHGLGLVMSTASQIESRLTQAELDLRCRLLELGANRVSDETTDGVILFDRRGRAVKANEQASLLLLDRFGSKFGDSHLQLADLTLRSDGRHLVAPDWADSEGLTALTVDGQQVGAVLTIPSRRGHRARTAVAREYLNSQPFHGVVGHSNALASAVNKAKQLAKSSVPVLLTGETGVGKEIFARAIHNASTDDKAPFVAINCGGFSRELLGSELFGHAEGSFTGARRGGMIGKIEAANGGTLFLDEIGEMPLELQPHFLRVLEDGEVYRIGETQPRKSRFRLIAATNRELKEQIRGGEFRMDLFYRIAVTAIEIPPLRERVGDVELLVEHYLAALSERHGVERATFSRAAMERLVAYGWPGNVRELRNVVEHLLLTHSGKVICEQDLHLDFTDDPGGRRNALSPLAKTPFERLTRIEVAEERALRAVISEHHGNLTAAAKALGIAKSTIYLKVRKFQLESLVSEFRVSAMTAMPRNQSDA